MDLSQPLSSLAPSVDSDTLTVLARSAVPLTGRRVASLVRRGSQPRVQAILDRLVGEGLVDAQPAGRAVLYTLNREHLLAEPVVAASSAADLLLERIKSQIGSWAVPAVHASLFGSFARATSGSASDIDVLVVRPDRVDDDPQLSEQWSAQLASLEDRVRRWSGNSLAWFETTRDGLTTAIANEEPLLSSWRTDAVHLCGERLARLLTEVA